MLRAFLLAALAAAASPLSAQGFASDVPPTTVGIEPVRTLAKAGALDTPDLHAEWSGGVQWLEGVSFSGMAFGGGLYYGRNWFAGSTVAVEADVPVEIVFDAGLSTVARVWRRDQGYANAGTGHFRGAAYDVSDPSAPRRLNVTFVESAPDCGSANGVWGPGRDGTGCREYLYIMASSYDGDGSTYVDTPSGFGLDLLYALAARIPDDRSLYEAAGTLTVDFSPLRFLSVEVPANGESELSAQFTPRAGIPSDASIVFTYARDGSQPQRVAPTIPTEPSAFIAEATAYGLDSSAMYTFGARLEDADGALLSESASARLQPLVALNASLVGRWEERSSWADVWGYVAPDGTEYALIALQNYGLSIIDLSASPLVEAGFIPTAVGASDSKDVKVHEHYAYLVNETGPIQIVDLSDPYAPEQVGLLDTQPGVLNGGAHNAWIDSGYLYAIGGRSERDWVRIYSLETPTAPQFVGEHPSFYYHDFYVDGTRGYGSGIYGDGVEILDLTDKSNPQSIGIFNYPGSGAHNVCGTTNGDYVFVGDEIGSAGNWTRIFDVSDPLNVEFVGDIVVDPEAVVHNCYVVGDLLHIGHYTEGYRVFDIRHPEAPTVAAVYDTFLQPEYGFGGVWSVYPYFPSGRIAVSDRNSGLFLIELTGNATGTPPEPAPAPLAVALGPNPADGSVRLTVRLPETSYVRLSIHDVRGREIALLTEGSTAGTLRQSVETADWEPGVYLVRLVLNDEVTTRTFTVVR